LESKKVFDVAIIGAGAAGLQLLYEYSSIPRAKPSHILLIDSGNRSEKSWCFWQGHHPIFEGLIEKKWNQLAFIDEQGREIRSAIDPLQYHYISSERFFDYFFEEFIPKNPMIKVVSGLAKEVCSIEGKYQIDMSDGDSFFSEQVFDSRFDPDSAHNESELFQHFYGKFVRTDTPIFDSQVATLMDFSRKQTDENFSCFHYILPFSETYALVETTVFSKKAYELEKYQAIWKDYWETNFENHAYELVKEEIGTIPMSLFTFPKEQQGITRIGTAAGQVKASTGYAFTRMNEDAKNIVGNRSRRKPRRFRFYDRLLLSIIKNDTAKIPRVMSQLFASVSMPHILNFLDEKSSLMQEIKIFSQLPIRLFLKHAWKNFFSTK
jgi:lycopene beta-cyclase